MLSLSYATCEQLDHRYQQPGEQYVKRQSSWILKNRIRVVSLLDVNMEEKNLTINQLKHPDKNE